VQRHIAATNRRWRGGSLLIVAGLLTAGVLGCHVTWDDVTSRDFKFQDLYTDPPPPLVVLKDSKDGNKRGKAYSQLTEPNRNGGKPEDQDSVLGILATGAKTESSYYARLQAMRKLGEFKDRRAAPALIEAYFAADSLSPSDTREQSLRLISLFRCEVLRGLGNNGSPEAVELLTKVLTQPAPDKKEKPLKIGMVLDERLAAARALSHFPQYNSTEALLSVLKTEQDVALRDCVGESLQTCTGKKLPPDYPAWEDYLHHQPGPKDGEAVAGSKKGFMELLQTAFGGK
jgi:HEAT repeat protein